MSNTPLSYHALAALYDARNEGRKARTLHFDQVLKWARTQPDIGYDTTGDFFYQKPAEDKCGRTGVPKRFCTCLSCMPGLTP